MFSISGNIIDIEDGIIYPGTIRVDSGRIVEISADAAQYHTYILPGFIDAHIHIESSMLPPSEFARIAVTHGTVACVSDPHEIANVLGIDGVDFMIQNGGSVPLKFYFGAPSCVPASPFETSGSELGPDEVESLLKRDSIRYLGEMMNFPGVIGKEPAVMKKIAIAKKYSKPIDGHAPGVHGDNLARYVHSGITTDHETTDYAEGEEKLALGMKLIIREGSAAKNFSALSPFISDFPDRCMFCCDDWHPDDLIRGHINLHVRKAVAGDNNLMKVLRCACVNPVRHYGLDVGLLKVGDPADFIVVDNLRDFTVLETFIDGVSVSSQGTCSFEPAEVKPINHFSATRIRPADIAIVAQTNLVHVIEAVDGEVFTYRSLGHPVIVDGMAVSDPSSDILKIVVVNRYLNKPPATAFARNFGLKIGAIASSVAHDSHNIIAVGVNDDDITAAVNAIIDHKGGLSVSFDGNLDMLPLPIAGLMSTSDGYSVANDYARLQNTVRMLGSPLRAPFMTLSFMGLTVIPELKISDLGLFDGKAFAPAGLFR